MLIKNKKQIFYWSPCLNPVGTIKSTIDGRGEVGVDGAGEAVVAVLGGRDRACREVARLLHRARREDAHQLVEIGVGGLEARVERGTERER